MKKFLANKLTRLLPIVALVASAITSPLATAGAAIGFDPNGGSAYTYSDLWTMFTDSALATGFNTANPDVILNPFDPRASVGAYETELRAQARVAGFQLNGVPVFAPFLNAIGQPGGYELTKVLRIQELVVQQSGFGAPGGTAQFIHAAVQTDMDNGPSGTPGSQQLEIWLDRIGDNSHARPGSGANTVRCYGPTSDIAGRFGANTANINNCVPHDGILILGASLVSATSSFATNAQAPFGVGTGAFDLEFLVNYVDAGYLDIATNSIFGDKLTGTINVPSQFTPNRVWDGKATCKVGAGCDMTNLLLKVDSSESFLMTVPEPGSLALVGLSLLGAGFVGRRRRD